MNIFKKRILHIIVASLAFIAMILIVAVPIEYSYRYYYTIYGYRYYETRYVSYLFIEEGLGIISFSCLFLVLVLGVLYQFPFMHKIPFVGRKLIGGLTYMIAGTITTICTLYALVEDGLEEVAVIVPFVFSLAIIVFGSLFISTRRPREPQPVYQGPQPGAPVYQGPQPGAPVYQGAPQAPVVPQEGMEGLYYELTGAQKILRVYDDRVTLEIIKNARAVLTKTWFAGTKEIYYADMLGIQFKESTNMILGYIQFETASTRGGNNFGSENSWTFDYRTIPNEKAKEVENFVRSKMREAKKPQTVQQVNQPSVAEELLNWKQLLDSGVISQEEFDAKKNELLNK